MNITFFIDKCREVLPPAKDLTAAQWTAYREKLSQFTDDQRQRLFDAVLENCKFFPKIADIFEQARNLGFTERHIEYRPHEWTSTGCQLCAGSGLVAAFWSQEFEIDGDNKTQILRLHYLFPYHQSGAYGNDPKHTDIRAVYRCYCDCGAVETLDKGIPRWRSDMPETLRRSWAA